MTQIVSSVVTYLVPLTGLDLIKEWPGPIPRQQQSPGLLHFDLFEPHLL